MKQNSWKYEETYKFVKSKRSRISPNPGFYWQLRCYEITLGLTAENEIDEISKNRAYKESLYLNNEDEDEDKDKDS